MLLYNDYFASFAGQFMTKDSCSTAQVLKVIRSLI